MLLLHGRSPIFVAPSSVLKGANGAAVMPLYWTPENGEGPALHSEAKSDPTLANTLYRRGADRKAKKTAASQPSPTQHDQDQIASAGRAPAAGSPYGSLADGPFAGQEIRPALPVTTAEPRVGLDELQGITEGNVVVEITIDESGNIVAKNIVQSMGALLDGRVLAALENWRFRPATRDGVPIPSKQDVVYHFKPH